MIEKKYTGIVKQGADVVANPTLDGSEQALNSIQINGENFKIEGGGSGKLKLVAEGTRNENRSGYVLNNKLEFGKIYIINNDCIPDTQCVMLPYLSIYNSVSGLVYDVDDDAAYFGSYYYFDAEGTPIIYCSKGAGDSREDIFLSPNIKVYELELGGSSSGGESTDNDEIIRLEAYEQIFYDSNYEVTDMDDQVSAIEARFYSGHFDYAKPFKVVITNRENPEQFLEIRFNAALGRFAITSDDGWPMEEINSGLVGSYWFTNNFEDDSYIYLETETGKLYNVIESTQGGGYNVKIEIIGYQAKPDKFYNYNVSYEL